MKILLVGDILYRETTIHKMVTHNLTHKNNIVQCSDIIEAEMFLTNSVVNQPFENHIDLIVVDDIISGRIYQKNLCDWVRSSKESYSNSNFRLSAMPIVLYKKDVTDKQVQNGFYNAILPFTDEYNDDRIVVTCRKIVKEWREQILSDLATLRIKIKPSKNFNYPVKFIFSDRKEIARNAKIYYGSTKIVSQQFIQSPKFFDYDWLCGNKLVAIESSLEQYDRIVKKLFKYNGKAFERQVLHTFYKQFPFFLKKDIYKSQIYDKRFYVSTTSKYHIPDFILETPFPNYNYASISEIKRHNIEFEGNPRRHENFSIYANNALHQASNYEDDFQNADMFNGNLQVDLIIGLDDKLTEFIQRKLAKHFSTINVVTHDKLMNEVEKFYYRLKSMSL